MENVKNQALKCLNSNEMEKRAVKKPIRKSNLMCAG